MTTETRISFNPNDVRSIRLVCKNCGQETGWNRPGGKALPTRCPWCETAWQMADKRAMDWLNNFLHLTAETEVLFGQSAIELKLELSLSRKET